MKLLDKINTFLLNFSHLGAIFVSLCNVLSFKGVQIGKNYMTILKKKKTTKN